MKKERAYNRNDSRAQKMVNAWEAYYKGQKDTSLLFQDSGSHSISLYHTHILSQRNQSQYLLY